MVYDKGLMHRVEEILQDTSGFSHKKMFGGICFLLNGNMVCGIIKEDLIVRVGKAKYEHSLSLPHTRVFDITRRPMTGWVMVSSKGYESDKDLQKWIQRGVDIALSLPPK